MIIRPFLYDFRKTITSKTVIILVAIVLLLSLAIIPIASIGTITTQSGPGEAPILYYHNGGYHYLSYFSNRYGDPISEATLTVTMQGTIKNYTQSITTNSSGLAFVTVPAPSANYSLILKEDVPGGFSSATTVPDPGILARIPSGVILSLAVGGTDISLLVDKNNASKRDIQVFYADKYGTVPTSYRLYYKVVASPSGYSYRFNETDMRSLGNLTNYHEIFDPSIPTGLDQNAQVWFELFAKNGTAVSTAEFQALELRQPRQPIAVSGIASFFFSGVLGFFIPLMTIIGSYSSYAKDRLTGVLESVLSRPVTRKGLAMSRFLSTVSAFSVAAAGAVGIVDLLLNSIGGSLLDQSYIVAILGGLVVEVAAFTGLIFLLSHLLKSTGALLGLSIGLFVVLDFFWGLIIFLLTLLIGGTGGSFVGLQATYASYYANPAQFLNLINAFMLQSYVGTSISSSSIGVSLPAIVLDGVLWAVAPFIIFLYLAVKRD